MLTAALLVSGLAAAGAAADEGVEAHPHLLPFDMPWTDRAPRVERIEGKPWVTVAVVGQPDPRAQRLAVKRSTARDRGERRARHILHGWVDDALAQILATPHEATAAHAVIRGHVRVLGVRPLVDGSAVVVSGVPTAVLRAAVAVEGVPWAQ
jgi:hypothetical protein